MRRSRQPETELESADPLDATRPTSANVGASDSTLLVLLAGVIILLVLCIGFVLIAA